MGKMALFSLRPAMKLARVVKGSHGKEKYKPRALEKKIREVAFLCLGPLIPPATPPVRLGLSGRNSGKTPDMLSERVLEFPSRVRLGSKL